jgi:hypothetical protein
MHPHPHLQTRLPLLLAVLLLPVAPSALLHAQQQTLVAVVATPTVALSAVLAWLQQGGLPASPAWPRQHP